MIKTTKSLAAGIATIASLAIGGAAGATPISTADILADWTQGPDLLSTSNLAWANSGGNLAGTGNHTGTIVSDFIADLDYAFSATHNPNDNDTFGMLFGWQNADNHYRVSWSDDWGETGTQPNAISNGRPGFRIVKTSDGMNTLLYSSATDYTSSNDYSIAVQATSGGGFSVVARNETTDTELENQSFMDSTFTSGNVGFYHSFQGGGSNWFNVDFTQGTTEPVTPNPIPVPMSLPLMASGLGLLVVARRRKFV